MFLLSDCPRSRGVVSTYFLIVGPLAARPAAASGDAWLVGIEELFDGGDVGRAQAKGIEQAWEMGAEKICFIHGHGRARGISPGFVNTNTGYFGLCVRRALRINKELRRWIKYTTLDCDDWGATTVKLKANRNPTRTVLDLAVLPARSYAR